MAELPLAQLQALLDKEAIRDCLMRYSRALDERSPTEFEGVFWPDAVLDYQEFNGPPARFIEYSFGIMKTMKTHHLLGQMRVVLESAQTAAVETYFLVAHRIAASGDGNCDLLVRGRYRDRFNKRDGEWRIKHRKLIRDLDTVVPWHVRTGTGILSDVPTVGKPASWVHV